MVICLANPFESMREKSASRPRPARSSRHAMHGFVRSGVKVDFDVAQMQRQKTAPYVSTARFFLASGDLFPKREQIACIADIPAALLAALQQGFLFGTMISQ